VLLDQVQDAQAPAVDTITTLPNLDLFLLLPKHGASNMTKAELKKEKDSYIAQINSEIKKYDLEEMKTDVTYKVAVIVNNLKKSEKLLINDENRNIRQLDKVEHMQKTLQEDFQNVKDSLEATEKLKQRAVQNFEAVEKENADDKKKLEA
jgi:hypothetical protein